MAWLLIGLVWPSVLTGKSGSWHLLPAQPVSPGQPEQLGTQGTASKAIPDHKDACPDLQGPAGLLYRESH